MFIGRLKREAIASGDPDMQKQFAQLIELAGVAAGDEAPTPEVMPVLPMQLDFDGLRLSVFSVISTFGTPQDITADEIRIEGFYPADDATATFFRQRAASPAEGVLV